MSAARRSRTCAASASPFSSTRANTISASTASSRRPPPERRSLVDGAIVGLLFHSTGGERFERRSERGGRRACRLAMPIPVDRAGNTTGIIGSPSPGRRKNAAIVVRPATSVTIRDGVPAGWRRGFRTPPAQRRLTPNRGRPALRAPFPRRLRSRPRPDDLAVRPARRIQQAPARTVGCEVDNRLVDQTFSRHLAPTS